MKAVCLAAVLALGLAGCARQTAPAPPATPQAPPQSFTWTWHPLGSLAVVEGEVAEPTDLVLEGRSIRESRFAEPGPVRWEFFRPPNGEAAVLRTESGQVLARFEFTLPSAKPASRTPRIARRGTPKEPPPAPALPAPRAALPEPPRTRAGTHPSPAPVAPLKARRPSALPEAPASAPKQAAVPAAPGPRFIVPPAPPAPQPEPPRTRAGSHPSPVSVAPLKARRPSVLPEAPASAPKQAAVPSPLAPRLILPPAPYPPVARTASWPGVGEALNLTRGPGGQKRLLLSFDGGSTSEVAAEVLDALKARGVRTTIFLTGAFIQRYPALVKRMAAEGHELGNHTMNHPHFAPGMRRDPKWTRERVQRELLEADAALVRLLGRPMDPYWRAPYGEHTAEIRRWAEEVGYRHVGWSEGADTLDWATPKERRLYRSGDNILLRLRQRLNREGDGLIVLMHLGSGRVEQDRPSAGLGAFMDQAKQEGWTFVAVGAFLHDLGKPAWDPQLRLALLQPLGSTAQAR